MAYTHTAVHTQVPKVVPINPAQLFHLVGRAAECLAATATAEVAASVGRRFSSHLGTTAHRIDGCT